MVAKAPKASHRHHGLPFLSVLRLYGRCSDVHPSRAARPTGLGRVQGVRSRRAERTQGRSICSGSMEPAVGVNCPVCGNEMPCEGSYAHPAAPVRPMNLDRIVRQICAFPASLTGIPGGEYIVAGRARRWLRTERGVDPDAAITADRAREALTEVLQNNACPLPRSRRPKKG